MASKKVAQIPSVISTLERQRAEIRANFNVSDGEFLEGNYVNEQWDSLSSVIARSKAMGRRDGLVQLSVALEYAGRCFRMNTDDTYLGVVVDALSSAYDALGGTPPRLSA